MPSAIRHEGGGRCLKLAPRGPWIAPRSYSLVDGHTHAGPLYRSQYHRLQPGQLDPAASPAVSRFGPHLLGQRAYGQISGGGGSRRRLLQPPRGPSRIRRGRRLRPAHRELERQGKAGTTGRRAGHAFVLLRARHQAHDRALSGAGRRRARCASRRSGQLSFLALAPGRRSARGGSDSGAGRPVAHHRRRHAARLRLSQGNPDLASPADG